MYEPSALNVSRDGKKLTATGESVERMAIALVRRLQEKGTISCQVTSCESAEDLRVIWLEARLCGIRVSNYKSSYRENELAERLRNEVVRNERMLGELKSMRASALACDCMRRVIPQLQIRLQALERPNVRGPYDCGGEYLRVFRALEHAKVDAELFRALGDGDVEVRLQQSAKDVSRYVPTDRRGLNKRRDRSYAHQRRSVDGVYLE